jgi:hypothetical protein
VSVLALAAVPLGETHAYLVKTRELTIETSAMDVPLSVSVERGDRPAASGDVESPVVPEVAPSEDASGTGDLAGPDADGKDAGSQESE